MKVILQRDGTKYGKAGDIVEMGDNFARKVVIPNGIGIEATPENLNNLKLQKKNKAKIDAEQLAKARETKEILEKHEVVIEAKVGKDNKMFGTVTTKDIADKVDKGLAIKIDKKDISGGVLNQIGNTLVNIKLHKEVTAELKVKIINM